MEESRGSYERLVKLDKALTKARKHSKALGENEVHAILVRASERMSGRLVRSLKLYG